MNTASGGIREFRQRQNIAVPNQSFYLCFLYGRFCFAKSIYLNSFQKYTAFSRNPIFSFSALPLKRDRVMNDPLRVLFCEYCLRQYIAAG